MAVKFGKLATYDSESIADPVGEYWQLRREAGNKMRQLQEHVQTTGMSIESLKSLNQQLDHSLQSLPEEPKLKGRDAWLDAGDYGHNGVLHSETTPILGASSPLSPGLSIWFNHERDKVLGKLTLSWMFEGGPQRAHGGVVAFVFDEFMATAVALTGKACVTAYLKTDYKSFTPIDEELRLEAWIESTEGKKVFVKGEMKANNTITASCEALFIVVGDIPKRD